MKARDVESRLQEQLPLLTDRFTREQPLVSITASGTTATATTASAHRLSSADKVLIVGTEAPVAIASITRVDTIVTVITSIDHDLTEIHFPDVTLSGSVEAEFNGTFALATVPNRRTFTFLVADSGPTTGTGTPILESPGLPLGYNGLVTLTGVPTPTTFTYELAEAIAENAVGANMRMVTGVRIHVAINADRSRAVFESKDIKNIADGELVLIVVLDEVTASRDRNSLNDGISSAGASGDNRQQVIQGVSCVVYQKVTKDTSGANARDSMEDIMGFIIRVLAGFAPANGFAVEAGNTLRFISHGVLEYDSTIYSHIIQFQLLADISTEDLDIEPFNVAFRDIALSFTNEQGIQDITASIDLDDEPLG